jgi:hypothetical protein
MAVLGLCRRLAGVALEAHPAALRTLARPQMSLPIVGRVAPLLTRMNFHAYTSVEDVIEGELISAKRRSPDKCSNFATAALVKGNTSTTHPLYAHLTEQVILNGDASSFLNAVKLALCNDETSLPDHLIADICTTYLKHRYNSNVSKICCALFELLQVQDHRRILNDKDKILLIKTFADSELAEIQDFRNILMSDLSYSGVRM